MARDFTGGSSDRLDIGTWSVVSMQMTIACWVYLDSWNTGRDDRFVSKANGTTTPSHDWMFGLTTASSVPVLRSRFNNSGGTLISATEITRNAWHSAMAIYDDGDGELYLDGSSVASSAGVFNAGTLPDNTNSVYIGNQPTATSNAPDGRLAFVAIWNVALTADECAAFAAGVPPHKIRPSALVDYRPLWGVAGEPDITGNHGAATITGTSVADGPPVGWGAPIIWDQGVAGGSGAQTLSPPLTTNSQTFYGPTVTTGAVTLSPGLLTNGQTFYGPTLSLNLLPGLLTNTQTFFDPTVSPGAVTLSPPLVANEQTFYAPIISQGALTLQPSLVTNEQTFYGPTVSTGGVTISPPLVANSQTFYDPSATSLVTLLPGLLSNSQTIYEPTVSVGVVTLTAELFTNGQTFFSPTLSGGVVVETTPSVGAGSKKRRVRERYIARFKGEDYEFSTAEDLEEFVKTTQERERQRPKQYRKPIKIRLTPAFEEEAAEVFEYPKAIAALPPSTALQQIRQIERRIQEQNADEEDDEVLLWLILTSAC